MLGKSLEIKSRTYKKIVIFFVFLLLVFVAYIFRAYDCQREETNYPSFMPFTLESAMMYSYAWEVAKSGKLKDKDPLMPESEYTVKQQMSMSMEYFLGYAFRLKNYLFNHQYQYIEDPLYGVNFDFMKWVRIQIRLWISLSAGIIFLWLIILRCPFFLSFLGGLLFAVTPAAIARATGQDLIRENFAIPLILLSFYFYYSYRSNPQRYKLILLLLSVFISLVSWDMTQLCFSVWILFEIINIFLGSKINVKFVNSWLFIIIGCFLAGVFNPYLIAHNYLCSPFIVVFVPTLLCLIFLRNANLRQRIVTVSLVLLAFLLGWFFIFKNIGFGENYSHFTHLLISKLKFYNVKPFNPDWLDFESKILWTPALHSATFTIAWNIFNLILPFFVILFSLFIIFDKYRKVLKEDMPRLGLLLVFIFFFGVLFIFMVRFQALMVPYMCVSIPLLIQDLNKNMSKKFFKYFLIFLFFILIINESNRLLTLARVYLDNDLDKIEFIKEINMCKTYRGESVLSDFTLSPMLKAYCEMQIDQYPKFELRDARDRVKKYIDIMYHGTERELLKYCEENRISYFVYDKGLAYGGEKVELLHPWSMRYMAAAKVLDPNSPVYIFFYKPETIKSFYKLDYLNNFTEQQNRFELYKVITDEDKNTALSLYSSALDAFNQNDIERAQALLKTTLMLNPLLEKARFLFYTLNNRWPVITKNGVY